MDYSNIKKIYIVFISFWIINFLFSNYQIIPNSDDAYYIIPAIGFSYTNEISFIQFDEKYTFFERFPFYTFIQGLFYKLISLKFDIGFYNYRLLNIIIYVSILLISFNVIEGFVKKNNSKDLKKIILFPVILSLTPISQTYMLARPEILGILFILLAIDYFINKLNYKIGSLFLGLAAICHPSFIFFNLIIFLKVLMKKKIKLITTCIIINLIPIFLLFIYYYLNQPESISQINLQAKGLPYFKAFIGLINYSLGFLFEELSIINLINSFYYLPTIIILIFIIFQIKKRNFYKNDLKNRNIIFLLLSSSLLLLILERNHPYLIATSCFFIILSLFMIPWKFFTNVQINKYFNSKNKTFFLIFISFLCISSWNLIHYMKYKYSNTNYLKNSKILNIKKKIINNDNTILITRPELVPYFNNEINDNYKNNDFSVYWLFPDNGRAKNYDERKKSKELIVKLINQKENEKLIWLIAKKNFNSNCLKIDDALNHSKSINIKLDNFNIIYETNKHLILNAKNIEYSKTVC